MPLAPPVAAYATAVDTGASSRGGTSGDAASAGRRLTATAAASSPSDHRRLSSSSSDDPATWTVGEVVARGCSLEPLDGLANQILEKMRANGHAITNLPGLTLTDDLVWDGGAKCSIRSPSRPGITFGCMPQLQSAAATALLQQAPRSTDGLPEPLVLTRAYLSPVHQYALNEWARRKRCGILATQPEPGNSQAEHG